TRQTPRDRYTNPRCRAGDERNRASMFRRHDTSFAEILDLASCLLTRQQEAEARSSMSIWTQIIQFCQGPREWRLAGLARVRVDGVAERSDLPCQPNPASVVARLVAPRGAHGVSKLPFRDARRQHVLHLVRRGSSRSMPVMRQRQPGGCEVLLE